jgi:hypothetical protein
MPAPTLTADRDPRPVSDFVAMIGEFVGTSLFMIFALGGTK